MGFIKNIFNENEKSICNKVGNNESWDSLSFTNAKIRILNYITLVKLSFFLESM